MQIAKCTFISLVYFLWEPKGKDTSVELAKLASSSYFLILFSNKRNQSSLDKWLILGLGLETHKMNLEILVVPESKKSLKNT